MAGYSQRNYLSHGLVVHSRTESLDHSMVIDEAPSPPSVGLVVRLRMKKQRVVRRASCEMRGETPPSEQTIVYPSPILKPKKAKPRYRSSSALRSPGLHLETPVVTSRRKKQGAKLVKFPTMLMLRLVKAKEKRPVREVRPSPSLKLVNLECPASFTPIPKAVSFPKRRPKIHNDFLVYTEKRPSRHVTSLSLDAHMQSYSSVPGERGDGRQKMEASERKVVFVRKDGAGDDLSDPDYDQTLDSYFL